MAGSFMNRVWSFIPRKKTWVKPTVLWLTYGLIIRYIIVQNFYPDTLFIMNWLSVCLLTQTILIYYVFGDYILPRYVYRVNIPLFILHFIACHILIYVSNYLVFFWLKDYPHGERLERDWQRLQQAGIFGFATNAIASFWSFFYSSPFAIIVLTVKAVRDYGDLRLKNLKLERDKLNLELNFLKTQVNPHFLFNTLNSVYSSVFDKDEKAANLILQLAELMRYNLYETDLSRIALEKELAYIQNYLNLERDRLRGQYIVIDYEQEGDPADYQIAPLLLITFVENAFKHGVKGNTMPAFVQIEAMIEADRFVFRVTNSVPTHKPLAVTAKKSGGLGLINVRQRLEAIYPNQYSLSIKSGADEYSAELTLRLDKSPLPSA